MTVFTDDFTGTDGQLLQDRSGWTLDGGTGSAEISSNRLAGISSSGNNGGWFATSPGTADHYAQAAIWDASHTDFPLVCRMQDRNNFAVGIRINAGNQIVVARRSGGSVTSIDTISITHTNGQVYRLEVEGSTARVYQAGTLRGTYTISTFGTETKLGLVIRDATDNPLLDDWESGPLGGTNATANGTTYTVTPSLSAGAASAASTAAGAALSVAVALAAGAGSAASTAAGAAYTVTPSLSAGAATAASTAAGIAPTVTVSFAPGSASSGASGNATANGTTYTVTPSLGAGAATAASTAAGLARTVTATFAPGGAAAASTAPGAAYTQTVTLTPGGASNGAGVTAPGAALSCAITLTPGVASRSLADFRIGVDFIPGAAFVANNFHAAGPVRMPRALATVIGAAVAPFGVTVERERRTAITAAEMPLVVMYSLDTTVEAEFVGASSLRAQRIHVEVVDAVRDGDNYDAVQDRVSALAERIKLAIDANPTLGGASLGATVEEGGEPRAGDPLRQDVEARVLIVTAAYVA